MNGQKLRKLRELRNFTQEYMAKSLGMTQQNYSKMEKSEIKFSEDRVEKLAKILDIDVNKLNNFDEKFIFTQNNEERSFDNGYSNGLSFNFNVVVGSEELQLSKQKVQLLEKKVQDLQAENKRLHILLEKSLTK